MSVKARYVRNRTQISAHLLRTERPALEIEDDPTDEWVWFDPYTNATYCPSCWSQITDDTSRCSRD